MMRRIVIGAVALLVVLAAQLPVRAATTVKVGGYEFAPYVEVDAAGRASGMSVDFVKLLNESQDRWNFVFVPTTPPRRYTDFAEGKFDLVVFEDLAWWKSEPNMRTSKVLVRSGDRYIAQARQGRGKEFFQDFASRRMVGTRGYHFGFANGASDPDLLQKQYRMQLVSSHGAGIEMILRDRGDIAVVSDGYLGWYLQRNPEARAKLLLSDKYDVEYDLSVLVRDGAEPSPAELDVLFGKLEQQGKIAALLVRYGIHDR
jgi:ABC-type amino acid transport substrate-binding protein